MDTYARENRLRELRQAQALPQRAICVRSGVAMATVSAVEKWGYVPAEGTRERLAAALGVTVDDIWPHPLPPERR